MYEVPSRVINGVWRKEQWATQQSTLLEGTGGDSPGDAPTGGRGDATSPKSPVGARGHPLGKSISQLGAGAQEPSRLRGKTEGTSQS